MSFKQPENGVCLGSEPLPKGADALPAGVPLLFIDASAPQVQTGIWQDGSWLAHRTADAPALEEIFRSVHALLADAGLSFGAIGGFIHNEGPGSILGIRLGAMALRIWSQGLYGMAVNAGGKSAAGCAGEFVADDSVAQGSACAAVGAAGVGSATPAQSLPVWAVRSLPLIAAKVALQAGGSAAGITQSTETNAVLSVSVFSEFRQGLWNWFSLSADDVFGESIEVIETDELALRIEALQTSAGNLSVSPAAPAPVVIPSPAPADAPAATPTSASVDTSAVSPAATPADAPFAAGRSVRCLHLRHRKSWESPPVAVEEASADLRDCPQVLAIAGLLRRVDAAEALLTRAPEFKKASGERHRGAASGAGDSALPSAGANPPIAL